VYQGNLAYLLYALFAFITITNTLEIVLHIAEFSSGTNDIIPNSTASFEWLTNSRNTAFIAGSNLLLEIIAL